MAINSFPSQAGGGQANLNYIGSVHMQTFNRRWEQGGSAGYYALYSTNQENGYAYFVGSGTSTGAPLNRLVNVSHAFTRVDIIAPVNDMISLYKAQVKSTSTFPNPFDADGTVGKLAIPSFPSVIRSSGNFVLPNNALPLINVLVNGAGAQGGHNYCGGGGAGGAVVKLTAYQAVGTTSVTIGGSGGDGQSVGGRTYFGNVYALGGGGGGHHSGHNPGSSTVLNSGQSANPEVGNGGGAGGHNSSSHRYGGTGFTQTAGTGLGTTGSPTYFGGFSGGNTDGIDNQQSGGGGGAGAGGAGTAGTQSVGGNGGPGHASDISGSTLGYGAGGGGGRANSNSQNFGSGGSPSNYGHGGRGAGYSNQGYGGGDQGTVVVRYYIP